MIRLWKVKNGQLAKVAPALLQLERSIENWVADDPSILGLDLLIIARQLKTDFGGIIDLLGIDREGDLTLIEMKRDQTPRDAIAQILDYGSWVKDLTTPHIHRIANVYLNRQLSDAFLKKFSQTVPETLNSSHSLLIVASGFDPSSRRIVKYLSETYGVSINAVFFSHFSEDGNELLACNFLLDQEEVIARRVTRRKIRPSDDQEIEVLKDNPYKPGTKPYRRFEIAQTSKTVGDFRETAIAAGLAKDGYGHLRHAERLGYIRILVRAESPANSG